MKSPRLTKKYSDQSGLVSFLVVSVIVTVLALLTLGFARLSGREAAQALDRQLSDVARYAAESGINDARAYLTSGQTPTSFIGCKPPVSSGYFVTNLDTAGLVKYSCVSVNSTPNYATFPVNAGQSLTTKIDMSSSPSFANLYLSWENKSYSSTKQPLTNTFKHLPEENSQLGTNATGLLEVSIYPVTNLSKSPGQDTNAVLGAASRTYYLYPDPDTRGRRPSGKIGTVGYSSNGVFVHGYCGSSPSLPFTSTASTRYCNSEVTGLQGVGGAKIFYVKLTAFYKDLNVSLQASTPQGNSIQFAGVESIIDATGVGNDVLQRIEAVVPLSASQAFSNQSMDSLCKLFRVDVPGDSTYGSASKDNNAPAGQNCSYPTNTAGSIDASGSPQL